MTGERVVVYGDYNCPWSYLASRRASMLAADGVDIDWRAVEHDPWRPRPFADSSARFADLREEMDRVLAALLPGEVLPYSLAGFVPFTKASVSGYAEAYGAGVAAAVRQLLFEAFWLHAFDLGAAASVRTLLVDAVRSGSSPSELVRDWGFAVDVSGGPVTTTAWRLVRQWAEEWRATGQVVPVVVVEGRAPIIGEAAVAWLGEELVHRRVDVGRLPAPVVPAARPSTGLASHSWVSQHGNRWLRDYRQAHAQSPFPRAG